MKKTVNFIFLRHGNACHNAIKTVGYPRIAGDTSYKDPELTYYGADMSIWMGCLIKNMLKVINNGVIPDIEEIDIVGCSPLIRSMETAYFMTRNWNNQPDKIQIFPFLRELDERIFKIPELTKYSDKSIYNIPEYAIKTIQEQKEYLLETFGKVKSTFFDFSSVTEYPEEREEPGDIERFIIWFYKNLDKIVKSEKQDYNVLIITHAGVIRDYFGKNVFNNLGFVLNTSSTTQNDKNDINEDVMWNSYTTLWNSYTTISPSASSSTVSPILSSPTSQEPQIIINSSLDIEELFGELEQRYQINKFFKFQAEHICGNNGRRCSKVCENYNLKENKPLKRMAFKPECKEIDVSDVNDVN